MMSGTSDFWKGRNVFVTGCTGLLGSWLTETLVQYEANVVGLIRDWVPRSKLLSSDVANKVVVVRGRVEDYSLLQRVLNEYEIDTVFHLAAQTIVPIANSNPLSTFESNIKGTWNLLEACRSSPLIKRIVIASSDKAYGEQERLPYDESTPLQGCYPYDVSKSCSDLLAQCYFKTYGLPVSITRCGNFYGGGDLNFNRLVPGTIRSVLYNEPPVIRSDGTLIRDYFYIEDAAWAYLLLAENIESLSLQGEAFNFSYEVQVSVLDLVNRILKLMDSNLKPIISGRLKNEIKRQYLNAKKARDILKWKPKHTLDEGLMKTINWYKEFLG